MDGVQILVGDSRQQMCDAIEPGSFLVVGVHHVPRAPVRRPDRTGPVRNNFDYDRTWPKSAYAVCFRLTELGILSPK